MAETKPFDNGLYCNFDASTTKAIAGADLILSVFDSTGSKLLAIPGQQGLKINRSSDSVEVSSKDTVGSWKSKIAGMKEWSIDTDGAYIPDTDAHKELEKAFMEGTPVCLKVTDRKKKRGIFGGLGVVTDYTIEAPHDDMATFSLSVEGNGALTNLLDTETPSDSAQGSDTSFPTDEEG